jgi:hypothetical protein
VGKQKTSRDGDSQAHVLSGSLQKIFNARMVTPLTTLPFGAISNRKSQYTWQIGNTILGPKQPLLPGRTNCPGQECASRPKRPRPGKKPNSHLGLNGNLITRACEPKVGALQTGTSHRSTVRSQRSRPSHSLSLTLAVAELATCLGPCRELTCGPFYPTSSSTPIPKWFQHIPGNSSGFNFVLNMFPPQSPLIHNPFPPEC